MKNRRIKARAIHTMSVLFILMLIVMPLGTVGAATLSEPAYGTITVDGDYSEWDLSADFYANMFRAADPTKSIESKLYLRYDCYSETLYALVLAEPGIYILTDADSYIKWGTSVKLVDETDAPPDGSLPEFAWINSRYDAALGMNIADGWEAAVYVAVGDYTNLNVHAQVYDDGSQTSAVEDRSIPVSMVCYDFGDLPEDPSVPGYNITTLANDGARHIPGNIFLGSSVDKEADGQPSQLADGDDNNGADDEDGGIRIANPPEYWNQGEGAIEVTVTGGKACLSGWMDFWNHNLNGGLGDVGTDGDFTDVGTGWTEHIIDGLPLDPGSTVITFTLPLDAATYPIYARFRLAPDLNEDGICSDGEVQQMSASAINSEVPQLTGLINNGEVEDYVFNFNETAVSLQNFTAYPVNTTTAVALPAILGVGMLGLFWRSRRRL